MTLRKDILRAVSGLFYLLVLMSCSSPASTPLAALEDGKKLPALTRSTTVKGYYSNLQTALLSRGLMRTDGGGAETPFDTTDMMRDFKALAFFDEYPNGNGFQRGNTKQVHLSKWTKPVRIRLIFGPSLDKAAREADLKTVSKYVSRLAKITAHPINLVKQRSNFDILVVNEDERAQILSQFTQNGKSIGSNAEKLLQDIPREVHCVVLAFSQKGSSKDYVKALAIIRSEHPALLKKACFHEEIAQGLGLSNDSPRARPSIFNDDDEFALLTDYDEILLKMLYDPRLTSGLSLEDAEPILSQIIADLNWPDT